MDEGDDDDDDRWMKEIMMMRLMNEGDDAIDG